MSDEGKERTIYAYFMNKFTSQTPWILLLGCYASLKFLMSNCSTFMLISRLYVLQIYEELNLACFA